MSADSQNPILGFVWRLEEAAPQVTQMAQQTGSRAIFDFSMMETPALESFFQKADPTCRVRDIKISAGAFRDSALEPWLRESGALNLWVECHPREFWENPSAFLQRMRNVPENVRCFPIIGDLDILATVLKDPSGIGRIVLKGCEASGFVSGETTWILYAAAKDMRRDAAASPEILIWGGVWTPEAAAAFLSTGAAGLVFESVHWLTDLVALDAPRRRQLAAIRADSTSLVGLDVQVPCRLFNKGNSVAFQEIKAFEDSLGGGEITE